MPRFAVRVWFNNNYEPNPYQTIVTAKSAGELNMKLLKVSPQHEEFVRDIEVDELDDEEDVD